MRVSLFAATIAFASLLTSCSKSDSSDEQAGATTKVNVLLTDNPFNAEEVNVDIRAVSLKYSDDDNNDAESEWVTLPTQSKVYNLLDFQNDVKVLLATGPFPHGHLHEIRLLLNDNNSIRIGGNLYPLTVPSGTSSGYKIKVDRDLRPGDNDIIIDFDADLSIHETGNGKYMLKPVLKLK